MNEAALQQMGRPTQAEQVDRILKTLKHLEGGLVAEEIVILLAYITLLRQQAQKSLNQKATLRELNRAQRAIIMENRWLRGAIGRSWARRTTINMDVLMEQAKATLWSQFRGLVSRKLWNAQDQVNKLAKFILSDIPGEPSRSEGAVDTIIRVVKPIFRDLGTPDTIQEALTSALERSNKWNWFLESKGLADEFAEFPTGEDIRKKNSMDAGHEDG